jgi:hypothetical protein
MRKYEQDIKIVLIKLAWSILTCIQAGSVPDMQLNHFSFPCHNHQVKQKSNFAIKKSIRFFCTVGAIKTISRFDLHMSCNRTCPLSPSLDQILTYDYCNTDIFINYALILLLQAAVLLHDIPAVINAFSTLFLWSFQIALCSIVGCVGVSVVWCAQMGILINNRHFRSGNDDSLCTWSAWIYAVSLASGFISLVYYAVIEEPITTVAHICALGMGIFVDKVAYHYQQSAKSEDSKSEYTSSQPLSTSKWMYSLLC